LETARALWRVARSNSKVSGIELFVKLSRRVRVTKGVGFETIRCHRVEESGLAVRAFGVAENRAGFAASSGISDEGLRWAVTKACSGASLVDGASPGDGADLANERRDLDRETALPQEGAISQALRDSPAVNWIEAGATLEVIVGREGWVAVRGRGRCWAFADAGSPRLVAQRGTAGWEALLNRLTTRDIPPSAKRERGTIVLPPEAAAPVVSGLVRVFHGPASHPPPLVGPAWEVTDEPGHPGGLTGGSFDDAGFATRTRSLAASGTWNGRLDGAGTYRRSSFREPPEVGPSNLVVKGGLTEEAFASAVLATRCRILEISRELWVLELDFSTGPDRENEFKLWARVSPERLLGAMSHRMGNPITTSMGPIVPALVLQDLVDC
jgi:hypothetical protein